MDADRIDALFRALTETPSRRGIARALAGLTVAGGLASLFSLAEAEANDNRNKKRRRRIKKNRQRRREKREACGAAGEACCDDEIVYCDEPLLCTFGFVCGTECGALGEPCCVDEEGLPVCNDLHTCDGSTGLCVESG